MRSLKEAAEGDRDPRKPEFVKWLEKKRWGQFFTPSHFNAAFCVLTPSKYSSTAESAQFTRACEKLAHHLSNCPDKPKPHENARIFFGLARLGVGTKESIERCLDWAREDVPVSDIRALSHYLYAMDRLILRQRHHFELVKDIVNRICELLPHESVYSRQLGSCVYHMSRYRLHHAEILSSVASLMMAEGGDFNLQELGMFARATTMINWLSEDFLSFLARKTTHAVHNARGQFLESNDALGIASMIRALEAHGYPIPESFLDRFGAKCSSPFEAYRTAEQTVVASQLGPVFLSRGVRPPATIMKRLESDRGSESSLRGLGQTLEGPVAQILEEMSIPFTHGSFQYSFELDFLIDLPGRARINLEVDGWRCHSIDVINGYLEPSDSISRTQLFRDKVLGQLGYEIIRLPVADWLETSPSDRADLVRRTLRLD